MRWLRPTDLTQVGTHNSTATPHTEHRIISVSRCAGSSTPFHSPRHMIYEPISITNSISEYSSSSFDCVHGASEERPPPPPHPPPPHSSSADLVAFIICCCSYDRGKEDVVLHPWSGAHDDDRVLRDGVTVL